MHKLQAQTTGFRPKDLKLQGHAILRYSQFQVPCSTVQYDTVLGVLREKSPPCT